MTNTYQPSIGPTNNINQNILDSLSEYDDFLNAYIRIDQASNDVSWFKADLLASMAEKLGEESLKALAKELGENYATFVSYVRVSRAFPEEKRSDKAPFSLHFQASFADKFDTGTKSFNGEERFEWVEKAVDENMSTRTLAKAIHEEKETQRPVAERSVADVIGEDVRRRIATVVRMANDGNANSLSLLQKIRELLESYA